MKKFFNHILVMALIAFAVTLFLAQCGPVNSAETTVGYEVGQKAPNFTLTNPQNEKIGLEDFKGKNPVLIVFWASG